MRPHRNLDVWKEGIVLTRMLYSLSLPQEEKYNILSQLRRAAVSVPTNIAEGAARESSREYLHFLIIARGSLSEIDTLLTLLKELGLSGEQDLEKIEAQVGKVSAILQGLINRTRKEVSQ